MIWYAAWCKADGSLVAEAFEEFDSAYDFYAGNPHGLTVYELEHCQWRGVFEQDHLARNILKTQ